MGARFGPPVWRGVVRLCWFELGSMPEHGVHDDGEPPGERDPCLSEVGPLGDRQRPILHFSGACSAPASRSLHRASSRGHRENGAVHVQGAVLALLAFEPLALPIEPRLLPSFFLSSSFSSPTKIMTAPPMAKNPPTTSSANLKAAQTLRSCRLPSIHPGNFERSIRCDDRNERAFENEDPRACSFTAYPDFHDRR